MGGGVWLGGNAMGARREILHDVRFPERNINAADTAFAIDAGASDKKVVSCDVLNLSASRRSDPSEHTWWIEADEIKKRTEIVQGGRRRLEV